MTQKFILFLVLILSLNGCTRDDICSGAPTTPLLIITFKDIANPLVLKKVSKLTVETDYETSVTLIEAVDTDSIALPLRNDEGATRYRFIKNAGTSNEIIDIYSFSYQRNDIYVNRACGYKTTYNTLAAEEDDEEPVDWIFDLNILKTTIEDETEAHITFFH